jgi:UDP-GlcNAc:undecaprenyl-phosphate/decaprenyl-phosphate GlcNAc-1-phosphate transferase
MYNLLLASFISFVIAAVATRVCRRVCLRLGIVDQPDRIRKLHAFPIPRTGGVAIAVAVTAAYGTLLLPMAGAQMLSMHLGMAMRLAPAALIVFVTGLFDDLIGLSPRWKLAGQIAAAISAWAFGVRMGSLAGVPLNESMSLCLTVFWLLLCSNALNLIDGLDGLAAGVGLFATITAFIAALLHGNMELALVTAPLAGALAGFLRYNFNPASIFLGDCGSLLIGFLLGCFAVVWSEKSATLLGMTAPLMALSIPILDTALSIVRRFIRRKPIFGADRGHIHHRLLDRGFHPRRAVLVLYTCSGIAATLSLLQTVLDRSFSGAVIVAFCACVWVGIHKLGYVEFGVCRKLLAKGTFRNQVDATVSLLNFQEALAAADDPGSCWKLVRDTCRQFGFEDVRLLLAGVEYGERTSRSTAARWTVRIPLSADEDYIQMNREFQTPAPDVLASLADTLRSSLEPKIAAIRPSDRRVTNW